MIEELLAALLMFPLPVAAVSPSEAQHNPRSSAQQLETPGVSARAKNRPLLSAVDGEITDSEAVERILEPWHGDLEGMIERRFIRALVSFTKTGYFIDGKRPRGIAYEALREFEQWLNRKLENDRLQVHVVFIPVARDQIISGLIDGLGDISAAGLTVTGARRELVDFSTPVYEDAREVLVTHATTPSPNSLEELAGQEVFVRRSSSYYQGLVRLNESLEASGAPPVKIRTVDENLEDEDILELVHSGVIPRTVVKHRIADLWAQVLERIVVHEQLAVRKDAAIAWAVRKGSPELLDVVNEFIPKVRKGTLLGNILYNRYLKSTQFVRDSLTSQDLEKIRPTLRLFVKYGKQHDLDWLLLAAQAYQESRFRQELVSSAGAVGIMQVLPSTARDLGIDVDKLRDVEENIEAGARYLRFLIITYFNEPDIDALNRHLFAVASYNAGPNRIRRLRREAETRALNPDKWFRNVEIIAARRIGRETVQYVSNIYKYYVSLEILVERAGRRLDSREAIRDP